ncbi:MAG: hypothetical protein HVN34_03815 [Methanobacteriaceae archaeon]|nr:hypothetical protein [Methanobacteriaceae archaeon]
MSEIEREIKEIKVMLEKIEGIIDSRLIGLEEPEDDEIEAIKEFEKRKKAGELELNEI